MLHRQIVGVFMCGILLLSGAGCVSRLGDFSVISSGSPQFDKMGEAPLQSGVEGRSWRLWFGPFPLSGAPSIKEALDQSLDNGGGDFMERARIYSTDWSILLISYGAYNVRGDVGNSKFDQMRAK